MQHGDAGLQHVGGGEPVGDRHRCVRSVVALLDAAASEDMVDAEGILLGIDRLDLAELAIGAVQRHRARLVGMRGLQPQMQRGVDRKIGGYDAQGVGLIRPGITALRQRPAGRCRGIAVLLRHGLVLPLRFLSTTTGSSCRFPNDRGQAFRRSAAPGRGDGRRSRRESGRPVREGVRARARRFPNEYRCRA